MIGWTTTTPAGLSNRLKMDTLRSTVHRHGPQARWTATLVTRSRHGQGLRWLARWVDHDGNERSKAFARKAMAQAHVAEVTAALTTGVCRPEEGHSYLAGVAKLGRNV